MTDENTEDDVVVLPDHENAVDPPRRRRSTTILFVFIAVLLVGGVLTSGSYLWSLNSKLDNNIKRDSSFLPADSAARPAPGAKGALNIVISGDGQSSANTTMIAHFPAKRDKIYVVAFPRDSYVDVPGHGKTQLNSAYGFGGHPLVIQTLENLTGVRIDHMAEIGFDSYRDAAMALGTSDHAVTETSSAKGGSEASRMQLQQKYIKEVLVDLINGGALSNPVKLSKVVDSATKNLTVDVALTTAKLRSLGVSLRGVRGKDITFVTVPSASTGHTKTGMLITRLDGTKLSQLSKALREDTMSSYKPK
jgi:anionic cell wall polymer biosynthesis LytR-Cps2A-Psr (LCP) family protein